MRDLPDRENGRGSQCEISGQPGAGSVEAGSHGIHVDADSRLVDHSFPVDCHCRRNRHCLAQAKADRKFVVGTAKTVIRDYERTDTAA